MSVIRTTHLRVSRDRYGARCVQEHPFIDVPASAVTWQANCVALAAEARNEGLFSGQIDPALVSTLCCALLGVNPKDVRP